MSWCECCGYTFCIFEADEWVCDRCEEPFLEDELSFFMGANFCYVCMEIVTETVADEEVVELPRILIEHNKGPLLLYCGRGLVVCSG